MFTSCLWQLWDWIDPQFATMDSKKLQALQQANSHLAPMPQTKAPTFQHGDFRPSRSPVFQNYPQYQSLASNFAHINMTNNPQDHQQQIHAKATFQQHQSNAQLGYHDQIYQSTNAEKIYHHQARGGGGQFPGVHQHVHSTSARLQQQFQALEQEKIQAQMRTQNEALMQQQQTFALRQQLNPPVPNYPIQSQTSSMSNMSSINNVPLQLQQQMLQQQQNNRTLPPSSLNLTNQYQPAQGPMKLNNSMQQQQIMMLQNERQLVQQRQIQAVQQQMYVQHMQMQKQMAQQNQQTPTEVPMIQQNIPGQVVNQAVQTQISGPGMKTKSPDTPGTTPSTPATPSTPTHSALERKKSEPVHTLKSPVAKRHPNAPVSLSGWLWKQGSEGLKVWRKRWFVLSEYCLFYYRGPEEEKIMGSVLLPSYRISACTMDDKATRKYAFKCEHTNMRTYVLAAENPESMGQWVKALMMAALMQGSSESESQPSISSFIPSGTSAGDNSDSGIHTFQSQQSKMSGVPQGPVTPASDNSGQQHQPLYANAPPKPRRVTDCGYSSPSPENAVDQYGQLRMRTDPIYGYKTPVANGRSATKTPDPILSMRMQQMRIDQNKSPSALKSQQGNNYPYPSDQRTAMEQEQYMQKLMLHQQQLQQQQKYLANTIPMSYNNSERRTPDTYGPPRGVSTERRTFGDYEDIYQLGKNGQVMPQVAQSQQPSVEAGTYRRPMSPTKYDGNMQIPPMPQRYTPNFLEHQQQQQQQQPQQVHMRTKPAPSVARPHSADFLEYEARNPVTQRMKAEPAQAPRPKSSLDINRGQDNSYYSESSYAEKMRQSALYLQKQSQAVPNKAQDSSFFQQQSEMHPSMSSQTLQREIEMVRANRYEISDDMQGSASVPRVHRQNGNGSKSQHLSQQEQFLRSASARLPKKEEDPNRIDGERKREESMKRLLEWKQRMLQSPLTRKGPQLSVAPSGGQQTNSLHLPPKSPLTVQGGSYYQQHEQQKSNHALQRSRSESHAGSAYNGESSEDEDGSRLLLLAGRSSTLKSALKANNENPTNMLNVDTNPVTQSLNSPITTTHSQSPNEHKSDAKKDVGDIIKSPYIPVYKHNYVSPLKSPLTNAVVISASTSEINGENRMENASHQDDSVVDDDVGQDDDEKELSDIKEDVSEDEGEQFEYTDDDLDEALAEHDGRKQEVDVATKIDEPSTPINTDASFDISEGHYLPMTPKKAILTSSASETSILAMDILNSIRCSTDVIEENPYIEMSSGMSELSSEKQSSPYELVMVSSKKDGTEPLYMELSQGTKEKPGKKSPNESKTGTKKRHVEKSSARIKKRHDLPDILKQSQQSFIKSDDSSDADDEDMSKEPMTLKSRSRFSLSDTFRPASYYLGASTSSSIHKNLPLAECIDSSDSEIVAPPPIPTSPPPLDTEEIFSSENFNTIKRNSTTSNEIIHHRTMSASSNPLSDRTMDINRTSRLSLQDQLFKQQQSDAAAGYLNLPQFEKLKNAKLFSTASNCSINTDDGSNTSSDFDLYNKIKLQSPSISADSLNQSQLSLTESPRPRPLPLSDDSLFKFDDEQNANDKLDHYLNKLETSDLLFSKEQTTWLTENLRHMPGGSMDPTSSMHYENINLMEQQKKATMYYDSLEDVSNKNSQDVSLQPLKEKNLSIHDALHDEDLKNKNYVPLDQDASSTIFEMTQPSHSRNNSNLSDSAPYYYSDLAADTIQQLNNQRDVQAAKKNSNYISHIQNLISSTNKQQLTSILKDQAEKEQGIDSRNIYESGSGRLQKLVNKDEPTTSFANKIYYHEKNTNVDVNVSTSIDNLLYSMSPKSENLNTSTMDCDQLWEEDAIWCESLRRVSQRHARSLDDLDRIESISSAATKAARISDADRQWGITPSSSAERKSRAKITRDVTYVNEDYQRTLTKKKNVEVAKLDDNDVYVQLACAPIAPSDVYEILRDDGNNIDRENIRQWDLMSSGLVKSSSVGSRVVKSSIIGSSSKAHGSMDAGNDAVEPSDVRGKLMKPSNYRAN